MATRTRGTTTVSRKHQVTIPVDALREAGLEPGDRLAARVDAPGQIVLERVDDPLERSIGSLTGVYDREEFERMRREEWD